MTGVREMIIFNAYVLILSFIVSWLFFSKRRLNQVEDRVYSVFLVFNILSTFLGVLLGIAVSGVVNNFLLIVILNKLYLVALCVWGSLLTFYTIYVSYFKVRSPRFDKFRKFCTYFLIVINVILIGLPINLEIKETVSTVGGAALIFLFTYFGILFVVDFWFIIKDKKNMNSKKYFPIYILLILGGVTFFLQATYPDLNYLLNPLTVIITFIMYHTIENPDVKMIEQLDAAKNTAEKANRAKSDFLSSMSHEIRTPLNAIVGFSDCIQSSETLEEAKENAGDVITASKTLLEIVNGILDISKIESGKLELVETNYNPAKLMDEVVKLATARLGDKDLDFQVDICEDLPETLYGDHSNLRKILVNFLTNSIKYTEQGWFRFTVKCVKNNGICRLFITVKDSGRGIKKEDMDKLFTKFQRLDEDRNTTIEGTGLGLAITKQLVEMMGGKIVVNSVYGEGSEFSVAIDQRISLEHLEETQQIEVTSLDLTGKRILIVDDNPINIKVASKLIAPYKCEIDTAESGFVCIDKINNGEKYDIILLDDMMPKMSGSETLTRLMKIEGFNMPVIALTANAINGMKEQYMLLGFNDYLSKPIDKTELYRVLRTYAAKDEKYKQEMEEKTQILSMTEVYQIQDGMNDNQGDKVYQEDKIVNEDIDHIDYTGKKVLIVDDNRLNIKIATKLISSYNFEIDSCESGAMALDICKEKTYDLIFMDYMMPHMDGIECFHKLRDQGVKTPIVCLTADAIEGEREKFINEGFDEYVTKPIDKKILDECIKSVLEKTN